MSLNVSQLSSVWRHLETVRMKLPTSGINVSQVQLKVFFCFFCPRQTNENRALRNGVAQSCGVLCAKRDASLILSDCKTNKVFFFLKLKSGIHFLSQTCSCKKKGVRELCGKLNRAAASFDFLLSILLISGRGGFSGGPRNISQPTSFTFLIFLWTPPTTDAPSKWSLHLSLSFYLQSHLMLTPTHTFIDIISCSVH